MGEARSPVKAVAAACGEMIDTPVQTAHESMRVQTPGGVFTVRWDERGSATALGQLAFFAQYLETAGLFEGWVNSCPLSCRRRLNIDPPCRFKIDPGRNADISVSACG